MSPCRAKKHVTRHYPQFLAGIVLTRNRVQILLKMGFESAVSPILNFIKSLSSPVQILLLLIIVFIIRKLVQSKFRKPPPPLREKLLEPMKKRDFTTQELLEYDGLKQKRVLLAVNFKVFDVTRGKDFYGPGEFIEQYCALDGLVCLKVLERYYVACRFHVCSSTHVRLLLVRPVLLVAIFYGG